MSTLEFRAVIKFLVKDRVDLKATMDKMKSVYGNECPSDSFIKYWHREFKCGRVSIEDEPRSGRPTEIDYSNLAPKIKAAIEENRKCDLNSLALKYNVSYGVIQKIVTKDLGMRKLTTKWIPHVLSVANKQERVKCCVANLDLYNKQPNAFLKCLVTMDETWVLQSTPETRTEASEWVDDPDKVSKRPRHSQNAKDLLIPLIEDFQHSYKPLPLDVLKAIKLIYVDLSKRELLDRCVGGFTQNNNESYNQLIWNISPKSLSGGSFPVKIAAYTPAHIFNEGNVALLRIFEALGVPCGQNAYRYVIREDESRVTVAEQRAQEATREGRIRRQSQFDYMESAAGVEGLLYGPGIDDSM
ncbi:Histone-lysine N-methyltransferase SETMAR [Anthophora plagiata]